MDIRKWFTSPKNSSSTLPAPKQDKPSTKQGGKSSKKRILSDSDKEPSPKKKQTSPKKLKVSSGHSNGSSVVSPHRKGKKHQSKRKIESSDEEEYVIESDSDSAKGKVSKSSKRVPEAGKTKPVSETAKPLKVTSVFDFFGSAPVERSLKKAIPKESTKESIELNHEDKDFEMTLLQLEQEETKKVNTVSPSSKGGKKEKSQPFKIGSKKFSSNIEIIPPPQKPVEKKKVVEAAPPGKPKKRKGGSANYMSYMEREGPRALGSKELPEGEDGCLSGLTFVVTGILESIERDDARSLIQKYGGRVMSTLSKTTKYVVIGRDAGSSKLEKAESFGTKQLDEDGLFDLIRNTPGRGPKAPKKTTPTKKAVDVDASSEKAANVDEEASTKTEIQSETSKNRFQNFALNARKADENHSVKPERGIQKPMPKGSEAEKHVESALKSSPKKADVKQQGLEMWVDKYKPTTLKQIIGQQDDKSNAKKLLSWLCNWSKNTKNKKPAVAGRWNAPGDGAGFKAALLSGPPGVGKTTTAQLVCKEAKFDFVELNASDTRSKKTLQAMASELLRNQSLAGCFSGGNSATLSSRHAIIMDEVDGMAGNEDRGGVQELIGFIKMSKIPIICICNDRNHPKIRSLSNYCFDLRFQKPRVEQIKAAMMSIAFKEGIKVTASVLQDVITASNQDIRQVLHNLSLWCAKEKGLSPDQAKKDIGSGTKHVKLGPFDVLREVFSIGNNKSATINDKAALFFHDYSIAPLFVQENYVHVMPTAAGGDKSKHLHLLSEAANSICIGDLIDKQIRSNSSWGLLPTQAIFASVLPGELLTGNLKQMINFPAWLGKNSNRKHMDRILQELQMHMRMRITGNKTEVSMEYLPVLKNALTSPIVEKESEGIRESLEVMKYYSLLREDFDSVIELSLWSNQADPRSKISTKVKSAFTRTYNKECGQNPYAVTSVSKKKRSAAKEDDELLGENEEGYVSEEEEGVDDDDKLENDAMIKVKKQTKKTSPKEGEPSTSKTKAEKPAAKRGRAKK